MSLETGSTPRESVADELEDIGAAILGATVALGTVLLAAPALFDSGRAALSGLGGVALTSLLLVALRKGGTVAESADVTEPAQPTLLSRSLLNLAECPEGFWSRPPVSAGDPQCPSCGDFELRLRQRSGGIVEFMCSGCGGSWEYFSKEPWPDVHLRPELRQHSRISNPVRSE